MEGKDPNDPYTSGKYFSLPYHKISGVWIELGNHRHALWIKNGAKYKYKFSIHVDLFHYYEEVFGNKDLWSLFLVSTQEDIDKLHLMMRLDNGR
jgi:hypothetical protein